MGVLEIYRSPPGLFDAIDKATSRIVRGVVAVALALYASLFAIVWRGTRLVRAQQRRLVAAEKLATAGEMASAVAHGLRNPLASIRSSAELCLVDRLPAATADALADIVAGVDRLEGWIRQYLGFMRPATGTADGTDLAATVTESLDGFASQLRTRRIGLTLGIAEDLPPVSVNPVMVTQIVNGLIANAVEAMPEGGELRIAAEAQGRELVRLRIEDTGPGMTEQQLADAFEPFMTSKPGGLGLGLPMAREILERHGARLDLASAPGRGTCAALKLPAMMERGA